MMPTEKEPEISMLTTAMIGLLALQIPAQAGEKLLRYDNYADAGDAWTANIGLTAGECWATVYVPDEEDFPVRPTQLHMLLGGAETELRAEIWMWTSNEIITAGMMTTGTAEAVDREEVLISGTDPAGTMHELILEDIHMRDVLIYEGSIAVAVCYVNEQYLPIAMMDYNKFEGDEDSGLGYNSGDRHLVLKGGGGGPWMSLYDYTYDELSAPWEDPETGEIYYPGDFVMRLVVETEASTASEEELADLNLELYNITPSIQEEGDSASVLIRGGGFQEGVTASIGTYGLLSSDVSNHDTECSTGACCLDTAECQDLNMGACEAAHGAFFPGVSCMSKVVADSVVECGTSGDPGGCAHNLNGTTDKELPVGVYDVTVTSPDGSTALLPKAFTVEEAKGCACSTGGGLAGIWWLGLAALGWRRRRVH